MTEQIKVTGEVFEVIEGSQETVLYITIPAGMKVAQYAKIEFIVIEGDDK